jgi:hypothetical protein
MDHESDDRDSLLRMDTENHEHRHYIFRSNKLKKIIEKYLIYFIVGGLIIVIAIIVLIVAL